ncbi:MAG TPA: hypothetical protein VMR74_05855 [Gammaproteobacteria bacterium]|nr:hypothetical protein [Gammaproteobacteria bacterium]
MIRTSVSLAEGEQWLIPDVPVIDISRDGQRFVYNTTDGLKLRSIDSFESVSIPGIGFSRADPEFSPDGQSIAMATLGRQAAADGASQIQFSRIPVSGGTARPLGIVGTSNGAGMSWEADGTILYAKLDGIWRIPENGGAPARIVEIPAGHSAALPSLLPGGEWVLFSLIRGEPPYDWDTAEIVAGSLATGERRTLYSGGSAARYVPTGHLIYAFGNTLYALPFGADAVAVLAGGPRPVVPGVRRDVTIGGHAQYAFSDTGTLIYVPGDTVQAAGSRLAVVTRNGIASPLPMPAGDCADPRVSPDGRRAAYTRTFPDGSDIEVCDLSGNASPRRLTFGGTSQFPQWSADGTRVAFQSTRDGTPSLYWQLADGSGGDPARLTTAAEGETHIPDSFSPDGALLTFTVSRDQGASVWILDPATRDAEELIAVPGQSVSQSVFSPNGEWIAYQSTETGGFNIFVQPYPLTGARHLLPPTDQNHHPAWSEDGSEIFYFPAQGRTESILVSTETGFSFGTAAEALRDWPMNTAPLTRRQYDVMPDGSGLVGVVGSGETGNELLEIRLVYNWFEELKALVPTD